MILGGTLNIFQFSSLYNPVDVRVRERVWKMLLMGVTQRLEMHRHINIFVEENFPSVSNLDTSFYPSDQSLEFYNVQGHDPPQAFTFGSRKSAYISEY